ncbi:MAG: helix-turn-helix transcriptional regulator [Clostridia bacterium]|nr:helix-turn-helix transcriptional regulator [Clostridia bacterium]
MDWVRTINNAIEYMENHLTDEITLADIAKHVNLSAFHFQRAFSLLTEMSPAEYLRKRRLSQAGADLISSVKQGDAVCRIKITVPDV